MSVTPIRQYDSSPGLLLQRMQQVEGELEVMQAEWAHAEANLIRQTAQIERVAAIQRMRLKQHPPAWCPKPTKEDLDALVLSYLWQNEEDLMREHVEADARVAGSKVIFKVAERTLSSKQSRLNADLKLDLSPRKP